jgi:hypothetical protein
MAVSDSPLTLDKERLRATLTSYRIDGRPVFDLTDAKQRARLEEVLQMADGLDQPKGWLESGTSLKRRFPNARLITDDNMGTEWR